MRDTPVTRRQFLAGATGLTVGLGGCIRTSAQPPGQGGSGGGTGANEFEPLKMGGSSTVFPVVQRASSYWAANYPTTDREYWGPLQYDIQTDHRLADYWASLEDYEIDDDPAPVYEVSVALSHSGTGLEKLEKGQTDVGNSSAPVSAEFPNRSEEELAGFTDHVVGVDAQPIVVSKEVYDAGVTKLTAEQVREIYRGTITDWSEIDRYSGPEKEIQAVGRSEGSGTDTAFKANMLGDVNATMDGIDIRKGQNQQVAGIIRNSNNAIAYMALAFVDDTVQAIELEFEGRTYTPGENLADKSYPLSRDLHCYTHEGTSRKEAAFLRMVIHDFGQGNFVETAGYATLTDDRQQNQLDKLSDE